MTDAYTLTWLASALSHIQNSQRSLQCAKANLQEAVKEPLKHFGSCSVADITKIIDKVTALERSFNEQYEKEIKNDG